MEKSCNVLNFQTQTSPVADPGFPVGGREPRRGHGLPRRLRFENFVCRNERIWTLRRALADLGGARLARAPPMGPDSFVLTCKIFET